MAIQNCARYVDEFRGSPYKLIPATIKELNRRHIERYVYDNESPVNSAVLVINKFLRKHQNFCATFSLDDLAEQIPNKIYLTINGSAVALSDEGEAEEIVAPDYKDQYFSESLIIEPVRCPQGHYFERSRAQIWASKQNNLCPVGNDHLIGDLNVDRARQAQLLLISGKNQILNQSTVKDAELNYQDKQLLIEKEKSKAFKLGVINVGGKIATTGLAVAAKKSVKAATRKAADQALTQIIKVVAEKAAEETAEQVANAAVKVIAIELTKEVSEKAATKIAEAAAKQVVENGLKETGKEVLKDTIKEIAKEGAKTSKAYVKAVPFISLGIGVGFAIYRWRKNDPLWMVAGEVISGGLASFPGYGTVASVALDATMVGYDIYKVTQSPEEDNPTDWYRGLGIKYDKNNPPTREEVDRVFKLLTKDIHADKNIDIPKYRENKNDEILLNYFKCKDKIYKSRGWH